MQGIYTYIPETNNAPREYSVAAILLLLFMVPISIVPALALLCFYVSTCRSMCAAPNMAVFCSSLTSWFPGMLLTYFLNDFEIIPVAQIITGINPVFTFRMRCCYYYLIFIIIIIIYNNYNNILLLLLLLNLILRLWLRGAVLPVPHIFVASTEANLPYQFTILFTVSNCCWLSYMIYYKQALTCSSIIYTWLTELLY
jgi:hypothetical protein